MKSYVFISNSTKPSKDKYNSLETVCPTNVSRPCIEIALEMGYEVFWGINKRRVKEIKCRLPIRLFDSHTYRNIFAIKDNIIAFRNLSRIIKDNNVQVIHCNTPIGGAIGRLCGTLYGVKYIIYTAHGFHFYKGAPLLKNLVFKCLEIIMARMTNAIITMNQEDFDFAKNLRLRKGGKVYKVHGVGISLNEFFICDNDKDKKRKELGLKDSDFICISIGDIIKRKNYQTSIRAIAKTGNSKIHYLICGTGKEVKKLYKLVKKLKVDNNVHFLGYREDIKDLLGISDVFILSSYQEGLPRSLMEAMAVGLPTIVSNIRGNVDLVEEGINGYLCEPNDVECFAKRITQLLESDTTRYLMSIRNKEKIKSYDVTNVKKEIRKIYNEVLL